MKQPLLGNHQRCWIWGRNLLRETLRVRRWIPYELHLQEEHPPQELIELAHQAHIPIIFETANRLSQRCGATDHQGVIAKMPPFPYASADSLFGETAPRLVVTDHLQDPFNLGAILRVADCFAATGILLPRDGQVGVTSQVARSSAGAVNHIPIARTDTLAATLQSFQATGGRVIAASEHAKTSLPQANLSGPLAIIIGNEGAGITQNLLDLCDETVAIPISSAVGSLNAAVAAGIMLYEVATRSDNIKNRLR